MSDPYVSPFADTAPSRATYQEAILAGWKIPILNDLNMIETARWAPKITGGDFTQDSDDLISALILSNRAGGGQVSSHTESTGNRFWDSTNVDAEHPNCLALLPRSYQQPYAGGAADAWCIGEYPRRQNFYVMFDNELCRWDANAQTWDDIGDVGALPVARGREFAGELWIPLGVSGYATYDGSTITPASSPEFLSFELWDNRLFGLTTDGELIFHDGSTWSSPASALTLPSGSIPRSLVVFHNQSGDPTLHLITDEDVWVYDPLVPKIYRTGVQYPPHPDQGLAAATWRDTDMYISVGMGMHAYNGGVVASNGLDRNDGVPAHLRGAIVSFAPEYNGLIALVRGAQSETQGDGLEFQGTQVYGGPLNIPERSTISSLWRYTGRGWFKLWQSSDAEGAPTNVMVSRANGDYALWWGYAGVMYRIPLDVTFANPDQAVVAGSTVFASSGSIQSGKYDHSMAGFAKLLSHVVVNTLDDHRGRYEVWYRTDRRTWTQIGEVTEPGVFSFGIDPDGDGFPEGDAYEWIEFDERLYRDTGGTDPTRSTPLIKSTVIKLIKLPKSAKSWTLTVPLDFPETWDGKGPQEIADHLFSLSSEDNPQFYPLIIRDRTYRVRVAQVQSRQRTGEDTRQSIQLSIIEVRVPENGDD